MKQHQLILFGCLSAIALAACGGGGGNGTSPVAETPTTPTSPPVAATPKACADLVGMEIPASAIGLPTSGGKVTTARAVETIAIAADLRSRVLPAVDAWIKEQASAKP